MRPLTGFCRCGLPERTSSHTAWHGPNAVTAAVSAGAPVRGSGGGARKARARASMDAQVGDAACRVRTAAKQQSSSRDAAGLGRGSDKEVVVAIERLRDEEGPAGCLHRGGRRRHCHRSHRRLIVGHRLCRPRRGAGGGVRTCAPMRGSGGAAPAPARVSLHACACRRPHACARQQCSPAPQHTAKPTLPHSSPAPVWEFNVLHCPEVVEDYEHFNIEQEAFDSIAADIVEKLKKQHEEKNSRIISPAKQKQDIHSGRNKPMRSLWRSTFLSTLTTCSTTRFPMSRPLYRKIMDALGAQSPYFTQRIDATNQGLSPEIKCMAAMRVLAYGTSADALDENLKIGKIEETEHILKIQRVSCFPGMLGSIDCMHWEWKKRNGKIVQLHGEDNTRDKHAATMILEAVATHVLRIGMLTLVLLLVLTMTSLY
ncbi:hypothetical protein U9M48_013678 [Paspalum notatum var. saurae]|uniref:Uncharacterized protein n=1 Tax=Paspalum notatum var. saurae TaxID=547442 RepID=A0AAQ3T0E4_PASNO